jgi:D-beta-D-heptose 7-phosphate kinase/D-beta-D-heptose 1-phosphate adenosyltransferase
VVPQFARARTLVALRAVDYCCVFTESDPKKILAIIRPDVLAKGSDYSPRAIVGGRFVKGYGGSVARLPIIGGFSTTATINRILGGKQVNTGL